VIYLNKCFTISPGTGTRVIGYLYIYEEMGDGYIGFTLLTSGQVYTRDL